uniref:Helicase C-terminal domain-containing protein n=1 Tax=Strongyloides venezuelensis TaxID=75913 RepID=A0A0K0FYV8_STRVS
MLMRISENWITVVMLFKVLPGEDMTQAVRDDVMREFRGGKGCILISTDVWLEVLTSYSRELYVYGIGRSGCFNERTLLLILF